MRALIQRVNEASVLVEGEVVGSIGTGVCVFIGVSHDDDLGKAEDGEEDLEPQDFRG